MKMSSLVLLRWQYGKLDPSLPSSLPLCVPMHADVLTSVSVYVHLYFLKVTRFYESLYL